MESQEIATLPYPEPDEFNPYTPHQRFVYVILPLTPRPSLQSSKPNFYLDFQFLPFVPQY